MALEAAEKICKLCHPVATDYFMNEDGTIIYHKNNVRGGHNVVPITTTSYIRGNYIEYKCKINSHMKFLSRIAWECHNNQVLQEGALIDHRDGDRSNN